MKKNLFQLIDIISYKKSKWFLLGNYKTSLSWFWIEFEDLSQYNFWDNIRSIDWLTSAKRNDIYIKKFQEEKEFPLLFLFDISSSMFFSFDSKTKLDTSLEIFNILSLSALKTNSPLGSIFLANNKISNLEQARWKVNILRTIKLISEYKSLNILSNNNIDYLVDFLFKNKVNNNIIFIFTDKTILDFNNKLKAICVLNDVIFINVSDEFENNLNTDWLMNIGNSILWRVINFSNSRKRTQYIESRNAILDDLKRNIISIWWSYIWVDNKSDLYKVLYNFFVLRKKLN